MRIRLRAKNNGKFSKDKTQLFTKKIFFVNVLAIVHIKCHNLALIFEMST